MLSQLPPERTVVALDSFDGEVVTHGWTKGTGQRVEDKLEELRDLTTGFLMTFVEREGRKTGPTPRPCGAISTQLAIPGSPSLAVSQAPKRSAKFTRSAQMPKSAWRSTKDTSHSPTRSRPA